MITIRRYSQTHKNEWNSFVKTAKNGLFLFDRGYMEYHGDRFTDHSLLFYKNNKIVGLLPANEKKRLLISHEGLTFGGILFDFQMTASGMLELFDALTMYMRTHRFRALVYKAIPYIYSRYPSEEDLYALYRHGAKIVGRDIASIIDLRLPLSYAKGIKDSLRKARLAHLIVKETSDFDVFMDIVRSVLSNKFHASPTHTTEEIKLLASRFPSNIRLFMSYRGKEALGGTIIYEHNSVAHTQYIAASTTGKRMGAVNVVIDYCITKVYSKKLYFSFGKSTERFGAYLNEGLIKNKEHYGGRGIVHDTYKLSVT